MTVYLRYGTAIAAVLLATAARLALDPVLGDHFPFVVLLLAVMVVAGYAGRGPALLATGVGACASAYFFLQPRGSLSVRGLEDRIGLALYIFIGIGFALLGGGLRTARKRAEDDAREAAGQREQIRAIERDLRHDEERLRLFVQHAPAAVAMFDVEMRYLLVSSRWQSDFGFGDVDLRGQYHYEVFPNVSDRWKEIHRRCLAGAVERADEDLYIRPDGREEWLRWETRPWRDHRGEVGGLIIFSEIITEQKRHHQAAREQAETLSRLLSEHEQQNAFIHAVLSQVPAAIVVADAGTGRLMMSNEEAHRIVRHDYQAGKRLEDYGKSFILDGFRLDGSRYQFGDWPLDRALHGETVVGEEIELLLRDLCRITIRVNAGPIRVGDQVVAAVVAFHDITDRKATEQGARFLAEASAALAGLVDFESTLQKVASLAVSTFADWAVVDIADAEGTPRRLAVAHRDPSKVDLAFELHRRYPVDPESAHGVANVLRTGQSTLMSDVTDSMLEAVARDEEHLRILQQLGVRSSIIAPLIARGQILGALSFVSAESGRRYNAHDLAIAEDLASRAAIAIENARLYAEVTEADRSKNRFLATLAHELRNPLASILNVLSLMRAPAAPDGDQFGPERETIERQVVHLTRLIDDLMDTARISRGKIELHKQTVDLATIVRQAVETSRPIYDERRHRLTLSLPKRAIRLDADPTRLEQILWNLLNNSAKYTEPGGQIALSVEPRDGEVVLRVRDSGIGIKAEMLPRVFDMFVQVGDQKDHNRGGLGIGLSLVRTLVEMHGGSISAHSDGLGQGSEFVVRLPALSSVAELKDSERPRPAEPVGNPFCFRILVVDDNIDAAKSLGMLLTLHGQDVKVAHDGLRALSIAGEFLPEVILLDIGLPGMDGIEVATHLRERPEFATALIVALSGWGHETDFEKTRAAGFDHHLVKPAQPAHILKLLSKVDKTAKTVSERGPIALDSSRASS